MGLQSFGVLVSEMNLLIWMADVLLRVWVWPMWCDFLRDKDLLDSIGLLQQLDFYPRMGSVNMTKLPLFLREAYILDNILHFILTMFMECPVLETRFISCTWDNPSPRLFILAHLLFIIFFSIWWREQIRLKFVCRHNWWAVSWFIWV